MKDWLSGKKSYLAAGGLVLLGVLTGLGYAELPPEVLQGVQAALLGALGVGLRAALEKTQG